MADRRPTWMGSVIAIAAAAGGISLVADDSAQLVSLAVEVFGLLVLSSGVAMWHRGRGLLGVGAVLAGAGTVLAAFSLGIVLPESIVEVAELVPSMFGVALVALGLSSGRGTRSRPLVTVGVILIAVTVLISGALNEALELSSIAAVAATAIAWDAAEQAISLGEHVGRGADSTGVELVHSGGSAVVGGVAVGAAAGLDAVEATEIPLEGFVLLLGAAIVLTAALYR